MTMKLKKLTVLLSAVTMTMLLSFTSGGYIGLTASAAEITPTAPTLTTDKYDIDNNGEKDEVYEIGTAEELYWFADKVNNVNGTYGNANAVLTADITVNSNLINSLKYDDDGNVTNGSEFTVWTTIGYSYLNGDLYYPYTGTFDGQGHIISGLYLKDIGKDCVGLFGHVGEGGSVSNIGVVDSYFNGVLRNGGVVGWNGGTITNCCSDVAVGGDKSIGGVVGWNSGTITNCYSMGKVSGNEYIGGVCGYNSTGTIKNCYYNSTVYSGEAVGVNNDTVGSDVLGKAFEQFKDGTVCGLVGYHLLRNRVIGNYNCSICSSSIVNINSFINPKYEVLASAELFENVYAVTDKTASTNAENISVAAGQGLLTVYFKLDDRFGLVSSYKLEILDSSEKAVQTVESKFKAIFANIGMVQIADTLNKGEYKIKLTLYDADGTTIIRTATAAQTVTVK